MSVYDDYLAHHGIKGQKWGVRHFQNPDGTLIHPKGRQRPESGTWKAKDGATLSDDELKRRNTRLQLENQYRQNVENRHPVKKEIKTAVKKILFYSAVGVAAGVATSYYKNGQSWVSKFMKYELPLKKAIAKA